MKEILLSISGGLCCVTPLGRTVNFSVPGHRGPQQCCLLVASNPDVPVPQELERRISNSEHLMHQQLQHWERTLT